MKIFRTLIRFLYNLTKDEDRVLYDDPRENKEPEEVFLENESTVETKIEDPTINQIRDWALKKIDLLHEADRHRNARALASEFDEWINIPEGVEELDYLCIEDQDWTDEQEVDVR